MNTLLPDDLLALSRKEKNARKRMRLLAASLFLRGENRTNIAKRLNVARSSVNLWVALYLSEGVSGLDNKKGAGRPRKLTSSQQEQLYQYVQRRSQSSQGGRLTGADIVEYIYDNFHVSYNIGHVYKVIKQLGFSWITTRSKHPKQSDEVQGAFKKVPPGNDPSHTL